MFIYKGNVFGRYFFFNILRQIYSIFIIILYLHNKISMIWNNGIPNLFLGIGVISHAEKICSFTSLYVIVDNPF